MIKNLKKKVSLLCIFSLLVVSNVIRFEPAFNAVNYEKQNQETKQVNLKASQVYRPFSVATSAGPHTLEVVDAWDSASNNVLEQVVETLFTNNLSDLDLPRINLLAEAQAAEELRRRDPVKRATWLGAFLVAAILAWVMVERSCSRKKL